MNNIIKMVAPTQTRTERKALRRLEMATSAEGHSITKALKRSISLSKQNAQKRIRATTPEIQTLDLILDRHRKLKAIEDTTNQALIDLRRRLVMAEKLATTRTRERDQANMAHKVKLQGLLDAQTNHHKTISQKNAAIKILQLKLTKLAKHTVTPPESEFAEICMDDSMNHPENFIG